MYKLPGPNHIFVWSGVHKLDCQGLIYYLGSDGMNYYYYYYYYEYYCSLGSGGMNVCVRARA
jgi:hypothetical protein